MKIGYKRVFGILSALVVAGVLVAVVGEHVKAAGEGSITGTVKLNGTAPHMKGIDMSKDPYCVSQHKDKPATLENVVVGSGGGIENVVLYLSEGLSGPAASAVPSQEPTFDQKGCMYTPHVIAVDADQKFKVTNSDQTTHNIHPLPATGTGNSAGTNRSRREHRRSRTAGRTEEVAIPVKCNIHPWMHGWHVVVKGPYAITDDNGLHDQERSAGFLHGDCVAGGLTERKPQKVTVAGGRPANADFTFKAK